VEIGTTSVVGGGGGEADAEFMKHLETVEEVATLEQRWDHSWASSLHTSQVPFSCIFVLSIDIIAVIYNPSDFLYTPNGPSVVRSALIFSSSPSKRPNLSATKLN
jgi:hypothetical protein